MSSTGLSKYDSRVPVPTSHGVAGNPGMDAVRQRGAAVVQDLQSYLPLSKLLSEGDLVLLLTPGVAPGDVNPNFEPTSSSIDPYEPLGRALARHHPWIRHVPYLPRNGITGTHVVHIRLATIVLFVISGPPRFGQPSQVALAEITRELCENRPQIIITGCSLQELGPIESSFPAVIQIPNYTSPGLESTADVMFGIEPPRSLASAPNVQNLILPPKEWTVEVWNEYRDVGAAHELWCQCFPEKLQVDRFTFQSLLCRDGYAMHYVVREPGNSQILGFCATYTTYINSDGERLIGSMAAIIVRPSYRQRGIGLSLHDYALRQLRKTRGVSRLQLGSTFPRLLYGLPVDSAAQDWFRRRGWPIQPDSPVPGTGQEVSDWFLRFEDWPLMGLMPSGLMFRPCDFGEFDMVLGIVERESKRKDNVGWYDQYAKLANQMNIRDIVLGFEGNTVVAVALTYSKSTASPIVDDLPWASKISDDVGGVTCICIAGKSCVHPTVRTHGC